MELRPYQQKLHDDIYGAWVAGHHNVLAQLPTGGGKCLGKGTKILMFDGTLRAVEDVRIGDFLMGPNSKSRKVLSVCSGIENLYQITPVKGSPYVVNESHVLSLKQTGLKSNPRYRCQMGKGTIVNIELRDYIRKSKSFKHTHKGWRTGVDFVSKVLPDALPPYFLGLWLGDGNERGPAITTMDGEIVDYVTQFANSLGLFVRSDVAGGKSRTYHIRRSGAKGLPRHPVREELRLRGLLKNKHIPHAYLTGDRQQRLALLAGLIDSDGHCAEGKGYDFITVLSGLADQIAYLCRSLGFAAYVVPCEKSAYLGHTGTYYRLWISGDLHEIPCLLERKRMQPRRQKKSVLVTGIKVKPIGPGEYFGFEISGDHLFMLGDFTVTHNTVTFSHIVREETGAAAILAHRAELVAQSSLALARERVRHRIIGPSALIKLCVAGHMEELRTSFYDASAKVGVGSVQSIKTYKDASGWFNQVALVVGDEGHHYLAENQFGKALARFPRARVLLVTATPGRTDGKGLGRHADGVADVLIQGPTGRELIEMGYLSHYKILAPPPQNFDRGAIHITASGEFSPIELRAATKKSTIMGDVVAHYIKHATGKLGLTFADSIENATEIARNYRAAGVKAEVLTGETEGWLRAQVLRQFKNREVMQIVSVALIDEGFDCPAVEVVSDAAATESFGRFAQRFGRGLRIMDGKTHMLYLDHVGNTLRHGLPDAHREWSLDRRERRTKSSTDDAIPLRVCANPTTPCAAVYERYRKCCPICGYVPVPVARSGPEFVDGDLTELDVAVLAKLRGEVERIDGPAWPAPSMTPITVRALQNAHWERQQAQAGLRATMALWGGWKATMGHDDSESYRMFYHRYGVDVMTAKALGRREAAELQERISAELNKHGVISV